jgi:hypothetical protein
MPRAIRILFLTLFLSTPALANDYLIKVAYFIPSDRTPTPNYEPKIRTIISVVADLYLSDLKSKNLQSLGLRFELDDKSPRKEPLIHLLRGDKPASHYNNTPRYDANEQWRRLNPEIRKKFNPQKEIVILFAETYDDGPADRLWPGAIARGAYNNANGGLAIFSAYLLKNDFAATTIEAQRKLFFDQTPVPARATWHHKAPAPRAAFVEAGIGAVAHELGHALGLPHDHRTDDIDIMGNGFRNLHWNLSPTGGPGGKKVRFSDECALLLMSSRYLNPALDLTDTSPPKLEATASRNANTWTIKVKASDDTALRSIIFFDRTSGSIVDGRPLTGKSAEFTHRLPPFKSADPKLQIILTDTGGHQTRLALDSNR